MSDPPKIDYKSLLAPQFRELSDIVAEERHTYFLLKGGRGSCKSSFISLEIILGMELHPCTHAVVLRKIGEHLADSVYAQLLWAIEKLGRTQEWKALRAPLELINTKTGQRILFRGADDPAKIKGIKIKNGYIRWTWYEEFDQFDGEEEIRVINQSLLRGGDKFTVFMSYNPPRSMNSWANTYAMEPREGQYVHHSTWETVPKEWLGEQFVADAHALEERKPLAYRHEYLGEVTGSGGAVFDNVRLVSLSDDEVASYAKTLRGLDFGYATDPTAYLAMAYEAALKRLTLYHEYYRHGAKYDAIAEAIAAENPGGCIVIADSAEPRSIAELSDRGLHIVGAKKGQGSVEHGIKWLQDLDEIRIDPVRCPNAAREFTTYEYARNRDGTFRADFPGKDDHTIDAARYGVEDLSNDPAAADIMRGQGKRFSTSKKGRVW